MAPAETQQIQHDHDIESNKEHSAGSAEKHDAESNIKRNPHPDFEKVQASRPDFPHDQQYRFTKTPHPDWTYGSGGTDKSTLSSKSHVSIDPYAPGRPAVANYKLLISGIIPRPIGFLSTASADGKYTNLAPFSYTQVVNHDPPIFVVGFSGGFDNAKDSLRNLVDTNECVINIISEDFVEAANACAIDLPYGQSEWSVSGLTPAATDVVRPKRVKESVFSIEGKLLSTQEFASRADVNKKTGVLAVIEGVRFWVREDAINEEKSLIDPGVLKPVARLGGISYARVVDGFEIARPVLKQEVEKGKLDERSIRGNVEGQ